MKKVSEWLAVRAELTLVMWIWFGGRGVFMPEFWKNVLPIYLKAIVTR